MSPLLPKKKDLLEVEPIKPRYGLVCANCNIKFSEAKDSVYKLKMFSRNPLYVHKDCKDEYLAKLRTY